MQRYLFEGNAWLLNFVENAKLIEILRRILNNQTKTRYTHITIYKLSCDFTNNVLIPTPKYNTQYKYASCIPLPFGSISILQYKLSPKKLGLP